MGDELLAVRINVPANAMRGNQCEWIVDVIVQSPVAEVVA